MNWKLNAKEIFGLLARLAVGGVFIYSGAVKALSPAEEFAYAIEGYRVLGAQYSLWAANVMPWLELYAGVFLVAGVFTRLSALCTGAMLLGFEALLGQAWARHLPVTSCGCFGSSGSNSIGHEFAQNILLLALAWAAFRYGGRLSADEAAAL
jgi:uncharacterized membrane protein YphA (DoxX/SURF4 family)